ncbi:MAG: RNA methyltransferase [Candidatus Omnitrophica bacterium]|nr:RNA methyltransferase [Candidatus Omnitrophota bacterium]MBU1996577.1 RNA methyltransferase [Candidatus Omnitrophota bacterium]MBU4334476.1 RNA methyltransferase [Candidatus Omnitrophota bacterium]
MQSKIISLTNSRIKKIVQLRDRKTRQELGLTIIEGVREVERAIDCKADIKEIYCCPDMLNKMGSLALDKKLQALEVPKFELSSPVFLKASYGDRSEGVIALMSIPETSLENIRLKNKSNPIVVVVESVEKPGNLGAILRTCDGAGVDGVIVCDERTDIYNPNVIRASLGTIFSMQVGVGTSEHVLHYLRDSKIRICVTTPSAKMVYTDADLNKSLAIIMGSEQKGLSAFWLNNADMKVNIPMNGVADSLNVSVSTAVVVYEALRQRKKGDK